MHRDVEAGGAPGGVSRQGWLSRLGSGDRASHEAEQQQERGRGLFRRFSAVPEEREASAKLANDSGTSAGAPPAASSGSAVAASGGSVAASSLSSRDSGGGGLGRRAPAPEVAYGLPGPPPKHDSIAASSAASGLVKRGSGSAASSELVTSSSVSAAGRPAATTAMGDVVIGRPSTAVKVLESAAKKYMHMVPEGEMSQAVASAKGQWGRGVVHPLDRRYRAWWYFTVLAAAITGWLVPFRLAFMDVGYNLDTYTGATSMEVALLGVFCIDILVSFFVGFFDASGVLVMGHRAVAWQYARTRFFWDVLTTLPFDAIVLAATAVPYDSALGRYIGLLGLLKLGRMYRVVLMYNLMAYNLNFGLLALTMMRNFTFCLFLLHWAACGFWFVALQEGLGPKTWVAQESAMLEGSSTVELYIFSSYWALVTFATLGYGDVTPTTTAEVLYTMVYVGINIVAWAYILGTITLLVTKQDEATGHYRSKMATLNDYCRLNNLPKDLRQTMSGLLRLHMSLQNETLADEAVLAVYPTTIRRKILRQLYSAPLRDCYLFQGCGVKFLDALMLGARVELFLPKVEIVSSRDHVNELYVIMGGHAQVVAPSALTGASAGGDPASGGGAAAGGGAPGGKDAEQQAQQAQQAQRGGLVGLQAGKRGGSDSGGQENGGGWVSGRGVTHPAVVKNLSGGSNYSGGGSGGGGSSHGPHALSAVTRAVRWLHSARQDSWRHQQEQLQADRAALTRVGTLARTSVAVLGPGAAVADGTMPVDAMMRLNGAAPAAPRAPPAGPGAGGIDDAAGLAPGMASCEATLGPSDAFAEVAYFTEVPKAEAVRSLTVCRVLVIPRSTYNAVAKDFPLSARQVLDNLKNRAAQLVAEFLPPELAHDLLHRGALDSGRAAAAEASAARLLQPQLRPSGMRDGGDPTAASAAAAAAAAAAEGVASPQQPGSPEAAAAAAAADGSGGGLRGSSDRPLLATMSLSGRYYASSLARSSGGATSASDGEGARQARALARFTSVNERRSGGGGGGGGGGQVGRRSADAAGGAASGVAALWEGGAAGVGSGGAGPRGGGSGAGRSLGTMSLLSFGRNADVARALEGIPAGSARSATECVRRQPLSPVAAGGGSGPSSPFAAHQHQQQQQQRQQLQQDMQKLGQLSERELQDASVCLTLQQQHMLADLLKLRQLVNKAAAKFDQQRLSSFLSAAASGDVDVVQDMLRQGMSPNSADYDGRTALMLAAYRGHKDVVLALLFVGADLTLRDAAGVDALVEAARGGHGDVLGLLTRSGARTGVSEELQATLLCKATYEGRMGRLAALLQAGCRADAQDYDKQTALHVAAAEGNLVAARILVGAGADAMREDRWGYSPLELAHKVGAGPLVEYLESAVPAEAAAAAADAWTRERTEAGLAAASYGDGAALARLLRRGLDADAADYSGRSLLMVAVTNRQEGVVLQLLAAGANPNAMTDTGTTPLLEAAMAGSTKIQLALMAHGARLGLAAVEQSALLSNVLHLRRHDQLLALLRAGADPAAADYDGRTPLHIAASLGDVEALRLLAAAVADSSIERLTAVNWAARDRWGETPLQEAERAGHAGAAAFLRDMEARAAASGSGLAQQMSRHTSLPVDGDLPLPPGGRRLHSWHQLLPPQVLFARSRSQAAAVHAEEGGEAQPAAAEEAAQQQQGQQQQGQA